MSEFDGGANSGRTPDRDAILRHELLTPLTGIVGIAELLLEKAEGNDRRYLEGLLSAARSMVPIIATIGGGGVAETEAEGPADLAAMLRGMAGFAEARAAVRGLTATSSLDGEFPRLAPGRLSTLQQVLVNLVDNAVKYTDSGAIAFRATCQAGRLTVTVSDTGRGIRREDIAKIRQPGIRGADAGDRRGAGIGLGVAVAEIERMGGRLDIASEFGKGSDFTVSLPLEQTLDTAGSPATGADTRIAAARVLIAEDNAINRKLVGEILRRLGYQVALAADGGEALDMLAAGRFDIVLMDIEMPGPSGIETARAMKALAGTAKSVPVIALTAHGRILQDAGDLFADVVAKPIDPAALDASLRLALASQRARKASA